MQTPIIQMAQTFPASPKPIFGSSNGVFYSIIALLAGIAFIASFAPYDWPLLAPAALGILFYLWQQQTPRQAFWLGWLFGLGSFGWGTHWIYISTHDYGGVAAPVALALCGLLAATMALYPALLGYMSTKWALSPRWQLTIILPMGWVLAEWLRGWLWTGFPWFHAGYSQIDTVLAGWAPLLGVHGVSWALATTVGVGLLAYEERQWRWLWVIIALWGGGWFLQTITWVQTEQQALRVSLIQANVRQEQKWQPAQYERTLQLYSQLTLIALPNSDLIIWPESAIPSFYHEIKSDFLQDLHTQAQAHGVDLLLGILVEIQPDYYNAVLALTAQTPQFYYKKHLVPFSEYLPGYGLDFLVSQLQMPISQFTAGIEQQPLITIQGKPVGVSVCYEGAFGAEVMRALPDAALLVNVSNDGWFGDSIALGQNLQMAQMRALEAGRYLLRATNTGLTAVIDPRGRIQVQALPHTIALVQDQVYAQHGVTPYYWLGNSGIILFCIFGISLAYGTFFLSAR